MYDLQCLFHYFNVFAMCSMFSVDLQCAPIIVYYVYVMSSVVSMMLNGSLGDFNNSNAVSMLLNNVQTSFSICYITLRDAQ